MIMEKNGEVIVKECFVQLEMLNLAEYDSDSSMDLPEPTYLYPSKKKCKKKKSSEELLLEFQNLADNTDIDTVQNNDMEEKLRTLEIIEYPEPDEESSTPPLLKEEKDFHIFTVKDSLQFFSKYDVTPSLCGYKNRIEFTAYEKKILSTKNVELEHMISSFLFSANVYCISDCKSFVTYLLKNLSVYEDVATINACYNVLIMLLTKHTEAKHLTFSTAEIFMLLFNYGIDIDAFQFLQQWSDVINHLEVPTKCITSRIPNKWTLNLKKILEAVMKLLSTCTFKAADLGKITVFFLWMCLDSTVVQENLYSVIKECISVCLSRITKDMWKNTLCDIAQVILSMEYSSEKEKWKNIAYMTEAIPVDSEKGIQLRKQISFLSLNIICVGNIASEIEGRFGFNLCELQHLLQKLKEINTNLMSSATKFVDICIRHLSTTKEEYQDLLKILKHSESQLDETAHEAKRHFATIHFKLSLLVGNKFKMYQISPHKKTPRKGTPKKMRAEGIVAEDKIISFDLRKVKLEPSCDINRGLKPLKINPSESTLTSDQMKDATIQNSSETILESSNTQSETNISEDLMLISKNVIVKKERIDDESYSETSEEFTKCSDVEVNVEEHGHESGNLELMASNIIVKKEYIDNDNYLENNEVLSENSIVVVNVKEKVNSLNNMESMSNNITVKKEHTDDDNYCENYADEFMDIEEHELSDSFGDDDELVTSFEAVEENFNCPVIGEKDSICDTNSENISVDPSFEYLADKIVDNIAVTQVTMCDSNVQELGIDSKLQMEDSSISVVSPTSIKKSIVIETFSVAGSELVEANKSSQLSQDLALVLSGETVSEDDTNSENISVDPSFGSLADKIVDNIAVTQVTMCDSNVQESGSDSKLRMEDSSISVVSPFSIKKSIVIETFSVAGSELVEADKSSQLSQDLALVLSGETMLEDDTNLHLRDEPKLIPIQEDFEVAQKSQQKDFGYNSSKMDVSGEGSEVTELKMHAAEKDEINGSSSNEANLKNLALIEVPVRTSSFETCMEEEVMFEDVIEEVNDKTNELETNMKLKYENSIPCVSAISTDTINNHCGEILNNVLSSVDTMTDICVDVIESQVVDDESSVVTIGTENCVLNINADAERLLNNQQNSAKEQNKCISLGLNSKQRNKKQKNTFVAKDLRSAIENDVGDRKRVLMKRKHSSLDWCKSLTNKYKVKRIPMQKHIKESKVHNIERDVATTLESVVISSVALCQSPTSLGKSMSNSVAERSKYNVQEFDSSTIVQELSETGVVKSLDQKEFKTKKYPLGKLLSGDQNILNKSRSCPSTPVHFSGEHIKRSNSVSSHTKYHNQEFNNTSASFVFKPKKQDGLIDISSIETEDQTNTYELEEIQNRKRKLGDPHDFSSSLIKNNFVSKLKELEGGSPTNRKKLRQSAMSTPPRKSPMKFSPTKSPMKFSPIKSPMKFSPIKSPRKFFDYIQRKQKYVSLSRQKRKSLLSKTGANLTNILREKLMPDISSDKVHTAISLSSDESDSDVMELYVDPKRFADKECMIIYESPEQVVLDSD